MKKLLGTKKGKVSVAISILLLMGLIASMSISAFAASATTANLQAPKAAISEKSDATEVADVNEADNIQNENGLDDATEAKDAKETEKAMDQAKESAENSQLAAKAKITESSAIATVQATNPDATIVSGGLENENGKIVYQLNLTAKDGTKSEVKVDAITGSVVTDSNEDVQHEDLK